MHIAGNSSVGSVLDTARIRWRSDGPAARSSLNLLAWRANQGKFVQRELEIVVAERGNLAALFSWRGLLKALVR
jgi:hypothetical protein